MRQSLCGLLFLVLVIPAQASVRDTVFLFPGTPPEAAAVTHNLGSAVEKQTRRAPIGGEWTYRIVVPPGTQCVLTFEAEGTPGIGVTAWDGSKVASRIENKGADYTVYTATPVNHPLGGEMRFQFRAGEGPIAVRKVKLTLGLADHNSDGMSDAVELMMGRRPGERIEGSPRPVKPHTAFFFSELYDPAMAIPTDAV